MVVWVDVVENFELPAPPKPAEPAEEPHPVIGGSEHSLAQASHRSLG